MSEPLAQVRCFLLDMDGTFYLGDRLLEGALRFIEALKLQGKDFLFLTNNSSKHARQYAEKITRLGLPIRLQVLTSGEATARHLLTARPGARLFRRRHSALKEKFSALGFALDGDQPDAAVLGLIPAHV